MRSWASWTHSSATALDKSERLCVFSHVSTSANVMAQGWKFSDFRRNTHVVSFVMCDDSGTLVGLVLTSVGSSATTQP